MSNCRSVTPDSRHVITCQTRLINTTASCDRLLVCASHPSSPTVEPSTTVVKMSKSQLLLDETINGTNNFMEIRMIILGTVRLHRLVTVNNRLRKIQIDRN
ncbi:hypothetical protein MTP99_017486 [Tenebrio molitor]|jgi:hypothetical protein|nr:hypothetical protein MTP99_017486 [Tenebrio molitor]